MSNRVMRASASSGWDRMSPIRFLAKTVLPAPMKAILGEVMERSRLAEEAAAMTAAGRLEGLLEQRVDLVVRILEQRRDRHVLEEDPVEGHVHDRQDLRRVVGDRVQEGLVRRR